MNADALILDVDGTLFDTNRQHARAWVTALKQFDYSVPEDRILIEIGKGGDKLVAGLLGEEVERDQGEDMRDAHGQAYQQLIENEGVDVFDGVDAVFSWAEDHGLKTALATASDKDDLEKKMEIAGVDLSDRPDTIVTDSDVDQSKPAPDTVAAAVDKLGLSPAQCVMIGDTPYDAIACRRAGVVCLAVCTGPHTPADMHRAGARASFDDLAHLVNHLDEAMEKAAPGELSLSSDRLTTLMDRALEVAADGMDAGELPIGAIVIDGQGEVVSSSHNKARSKNSRIAHAEILALRQIPSSSETSNADLTLVASLEPCTMCLGAAMEMGIGTIIYGIDVPANGGTERCDPPENGFMPRLVGGVQESECRKLLRGWLRRNPDDVFVRALLQGERS